LIHKNISFVKNQYSNISSSHALVILTEWKQFWDPDLEQLKKLLDMQVFDGRNILSSKNLIKNGFTYHGVGIS
jgi:UDPglucose 6-dehydrogenase